jgi:hypothetical protein
MAHARQMYPDLMRPAAFRRSRDNGYPAGVAQQLETGQRLFAPVPVDYGPVPLVPIRHERRVTGCLVPFWRSVNNGGIGFLYGPRFKRHGQAAVSAEILGENNDSGRASVYPVN